MAQEDGVSVLSRGHKALVGMVGFLQQPSTSTTPGLFESQTKNQDVGSDWEVSIAASIYKP